MSVPDLSKVTKWESRSRTVHSHWDGLEVQRVFRMRPFSEAYQVQAALEGSVYRETTTSDWTRRLPARDAYYPDCYCNETRIDHVDPQKDSISFSPSIRWSRFLATKDAETQLLDFLERTRLVGEQPAGGAFLTASYRPLVSAYIPQVSPGDPDSQPSDLERSKMFDWIGPTFTPGAKSIPWPLGLGVQVAGFQPFSAHVPPDAANPVHVPTHGFTIRRLLVGKIPWKTINALTNTVNSGLLPSEGMTAANMLEGPGWPYRENRATTTLPLFPPGTLRFDKCEVKNHYSPIAAHQHWHELTYHFSWLCLSSKNVHDAAGLDLTALGGLAPVTWNHVLMRPTKLTDKAPVGWYFVQKYSPWTIVRLPFIRNVTVADGPIYGPSDFDTLFDLQAE